MDVYTIDLETAAGKTHSLQECKDHHILLVNIANKCGFHGQEQELIDWAKEWQDKPFVLVLFPCHQFLRQEKRSEKELCHLASNLPKNVWVLKKGEVLGDHAHPLYQQLKKELKGDLHLPVVPWNYTKIWIAPNASTVRRFLPSEGVESVKKELSQHLS